MKKASGAARRRQSQQSPEKRRPAHLGKTQYPDRCRRYSDYSPRNIKNPETAQLPWTKSANPTLTAGTERHGRMAGDRAATSTIEID